MEEQGTKAGVESSALYPMRVVARLTGLTPDTIRVWERRHGAVVPHRTDGNARRYSAEDVRRLQLLRQATENGHSIQSIANLPEPELRRLLGESGREPSPVPAQAVMTDAHERVREDYLAAVMRFDLRGAAEVLARGAALMTATDFTLHVLAPLMQTVGERWSHGHLGVAHEHVVSAQVKGMLLSFLRLVTPGPGAPRIVVTTPEDHLHELGALVGAFLAAGRGFEAVYLGPNLPERDIERAVELTGAQILLLSVVRDMPTPELLRFGDTVRRLASRVDVWIGAPPHHAARSLVRSARFFDTFEEFDAALANRTV